VTAQASALPSRPVPEIRLRHRAEHALFLLARTAIGALPLGAARPLGAALGELAWLAGVRRDVVRANLALVFPDWAPARRRALARACYRHFGAMVFDTVAMSRLDPVAVCARLTLVGWERLEQAEALGNGLLVISAHLGNWEVGGRPLGLYRGPIHPIARPFNNPLVYRFMEAERERFGQRLIDKRGAAKQIFRVLRDGGKVGIIMDQRVRPGQGIVVPFLGHPALATPLPAAAALRTRAVAVPVIAWPEPHGRYRVEIGEPILPPEGEHGEEAVAALTTRYLEVLGAEIRRRPEQWLWLHRRWRLD